MNRSLTAVIAVAVLAGGYWLQSKQPSTAIAPPVYRDGQRTLSHDEILRTWGNPASLPDHFARHGRDFGARTADEYALLAYQFQRRATANHYQAKIDRGRVLRLYDPQSGTFGAYNPDGTTKTFFKPRNARYFDRQPGELVNLEAPR